MKTQCRCGNILDSEKGEVIKSYFQKPGGGRVTVCDECANKLGLNDKEKWDCFHYDKLNESQTKTTNKTS